MRCLALLLCFLALIGCRRADPVPAGPPVARILVLFRDGEVVLHLPTPPPSGAWEIMDLGVWASLPLDWSHDPRLGVGRQDREAPSMVVLRAPDGTVHRKELRPHPDLVRTREHLDRGDQLDPDDREFLVTLGVLWVLSWVRR